MTPALTVNIRFIGRLKITSVPKVPPEKIMRIKVLATKQKRADKELGRDRLLGRLEPREKRM